MPEYLSPGVYVEEIDAGPKPIEGVSTSTAGAIGITERGPSDGKPELVTSFNDFVRRFGGFLQEPDAGLRNQWEFNASEGGRWWQFPLAVKGFFDNGGQRLYVKRVFAEAATAATATLGKGVISELVDDATATDTTIRVRHLLGVAVGDNVDIVAGGDPSPGNPFTVTAYNATNGVITLNNAIGQELKEGRDFIVIEARTPEPLGPNDETLKFTGKAVGDWSNALNVRVRAMVGAALKLLPDPVLGGSKFSSTVTTEANGGDTTIAVADGSGFTAGDRALILGREFVISNPAANAVDVTPAVPAGRKWPVGTLIQRLRPANAANTTATLHVQGASQLYKGAMVEVDNGATKDTLLVDSVAGQLVTFTTNVIQAYHESQKLRVIEAEVLVQYGSGADAQVEVFPNLRLVDDQSMSYLVTHVNTLSNLVRVETGAGFSDSVFASFPAVPPPAAGTKDRLWLPMTGGDDQLATLTVDDFAGKDSGSGKRTGVAALEDIDEISICMAPGVWSSTVHSALLIHCETLKDRFAILDSQRGLSLERIREVREPLDSKYGALYYPWIVVRDPLLKRDVDLAPSGHMAGIYARVDVERGVHKAPANEVIRGIRRIEQDVTKREQDMLNPKGINALRFFPGRGNRVWGARTISSDPSWKYINVRRLFIFVEESIDEGTQWVVFEPNDEPLWSRVRQTITNFLTTVWRSGALQGLTADEAFFVKCDRTTMTQDDIDNGRLIVQIGIAPVKPAEFVIFRIQQKTIEAQPA